MTVEYTQKLFHNIYIFFNLFGCIRSLLLLELFLVAASRGYYLALVHRLLIAVASVSEHRL